MKFKHFRNQTIRDRLKIVGKKWKSQDPSRAFEKPERIWFRPLFTSIGIHLLLLFPALILFIGRGDTPGIPAFLSLLFPFLASSTLSNLFTIVIDPRRQELTYLLPLDDLRIERQTHAEILAPFLKGLFYAMLYGMVSGISPTLLGGALMGSFIFIGLGGILTLSFLPRMSWLYSALFYGPIFILFGAMLSDTFSEFALTKLYLLPWHHALYHPTVLIGLLVTGFVCARFTRSLWWEISPFDRTLFYEVLGNPQHEHELDEEVISQLATLPKSPQGTLEKFTWKYLNLKERALVRAVGGTQTNTLRDWVLATFITLSLIWLWGFTWIHPLENFKTIILVTAIFWGFSKFIESGATSLKYLEGISLGPQAIGAQFQLLPLSLSALEWLHWKEIVPKAILATITIALGLTTWATSFREPLSCFLIFLYVLPAVITVFWFPFWNRSINHWPPKKGLGFLRVITLQALLVGAVLVIPVALLAGFFSPDFQPALPPLIPIIVFAIYLLLIRIPLRSILKDNRCDLMAQR